MNIRVLNNDLTTHGIAAGFESLDFTRAFNAKGCFRLKINANNKTAKYIKIDKIIYIDDKKIGYIDKVTYDRKSDKSEEYIIAEGSEIKDRLNRIIYPDAGMETDSYTNKYPETIIKSLINKNAGSLASSNRQIPNLATAADLNRGLQIDYSARYKDLSTEIYSLLKSQEMGLKAEIDFENQKIVFDVAVGNDLKAQEGAAGGIVLSLGTRTALEIIDTDDKLSYKNLSVTAGLGEGADRTIEEVYSGTEPSGYGRCEVFTDAGDIESDDEISIRGARKLSEISKTRAISVKANNLGSYQIGEDYDLGDYISVDAKGELIDAQVIKIKHSYKLNLIPSVDIVLNFDTDDTLLADISAKHINYDALLSTGNNNSSSIAKLALTSAAASITFTGLSIVDDGGIYDIYVKGATNGDNNFAVEYNGKASSTTYKSAYQYCYSGNAYSYAINAANAGAMGNILGYNHCEISLTNGYPACRTKGHYAAITVINFDYSQYYSLIRTDITSIKIEMMGGKTFNAGSAAEIFGRK